ncbi:MAG: PAS domain-containing protein [Desulfobacterales bacterium]|nr:MAG: PAS domain-containing protein [Desulfobacterales bacterium]
MKKNEGKPSSLEKLRREAEKRLLERASAIEGIPVEDVNRLVHELEVHQIELEMQNEELRRAQLDLEAARDKYSNLYDFAPVGYLTLDDMGLILETNLVCATMLGVERGALVGRHFAQFIAKDDQDGFYFHRQKLLEKKTKQICELRLSKKDGTEFYAQLESTAVKDEAGSCRAIRSSLSDITERKQAEMALMATKKEIDSIVKTVPDIIYRLDPQGRLTFVSDSVKRYGYQPEELLGTNIMEIVYPEDKQITAHKIKERRRGARNTKSFETRLVTKNDTPVPFEVFIISAEGLYAPAKLGLGTFIGTQGIARDITPRKRAEEEREKLITHLQEALDNIKTLKGLLPICASCKKIRDDKGYWNQIEAYIRDRSDAEFSHSICPECAKKLYPDLELEDA